MKVIKGNTRLPNYLSLFLALLILAGPVLSDALDVDLVPSNEFVEFGPLPGDGYDDLKPVSTDEFIDVDQEESDDGFTDVDLLPSDDLSDTVPVNYDNLAESLTDLPVYQYPYEYLPSLLAAEGKESIRLFVYGSLMDCKSAKQTLCVSTLESRKLAKAYGVKTIYNRSVPYIFTPHWGEPENPYAIAMLNTEVSGHSGDIALGILLDIPLDEIPALLSREVGYDLKPVVVQNWVEPAVSTKRSSSAAKRTENYNVAYILSSPTPSQYTAARLLPRGGYYRLVMKAARSNGSAFFQQWLNNTYLADGVTTVGYYELYKEKVAKEFDQQKCAVCISL